MSSSCAVCLLTHGETHGRSQGAERERETYLLDRDKNRGDVCNDCAAGTLREIDLCYVLRIEGPDTAKEKLAKALSKNAKKRKKYSDTKSIWNGDIHVGVDSLCLGRHRPLYTREECCRGKYVQDLKLTHVVLEDISCVDDLLKRQAALPGHDGVSFVREEGGNDKKGFICCNERRGFLFVAEGKYAQPARSASGKVKLRKRGVDDHYTATKKDSAAQKARL